MSERDLPTRGTEPTEDPQGTPGILELPPTTVSPSGLGALTAPMPGTPGDRDDRDDRTDDLVLPPGTRVDHDGVPVGPDGHPLSRRALRELRRRHEDHDAGPAGSAPEGEQAGEPVSRESLAAEGAALAARIEASGAGDPSAVDPELLRAQEQLAERARRLNTGLIARVPVAEAVEPDGSADSHVPSPTASAPTRPASAPTPSTVSAGAEIAGAEADREPVRAQSAHGLDSMGASAWSDRERTLILVAVAVVLVLLLALILALVL